MKYEDIFGAEGFETNCYLFHAPNGPILLTHQTVGSCAWLEKTRNTIGNCCSSPTDHIDHVRRALPKIKVRHD